MKKLLLILLCSLMSGCHTLEKSVAVPTDFFLMHATDLHVLSPEVYDDSSLLRDIENGGDGKQIIASAEQLDRLIERAKKERPDALILTGDIVFHGDIASHRLVAKKLQELKTAGVQSYVLPGNHDWHTKSFGYFGAEAKPIEATTSDDFESIYQDFGLNQAILRDDASYSYVAEITPGTWLVMIDASQPGQVSVISSETLTWLEDVLDQATKHNYRVITASHYNLYQHHALFDRGYRFVGAEKLQELLVKYPPLIHLSGHLHVQHLMEKNQVLEAATGSMAVWPHHVAEIRPTSYQAVSLMETDEDLNQAKAFFRRITLNKMLPRVLEAGLDEPDKMADFIADVNQIYFSGDLRNLPEIKDSAIAKKWLEQTEGLRLGSYIRYILEEEPIDHRVKDLHEINHP